MEVAFTFELLLWLSPVLIPVLAIALLLAVPPLVVGAATALVVVGRRLTQLLLPATRKPVGDSGPVVVADPWAQLVELGETNDTEPAGTAGGTR